MKPKAVNQKPRIKQCIRTQFETLKTSDILRTDDIVKYVKRNIGKQFYPDTIIRYLREMRQDEELNYTVENKQERRIRVIAMGEPHSL